MESKSRTAKKFQTVYIVFLAVGLLLLLLMAYLIWHDYEKIQRSVKCNGVIVELFRDRTMVGFEYEGDMYVRPYGGYSSSWYEGKELEIFYNPVKNVIYIQSMDTMALWVVGSFALIFGLAGLIPLIIEKIKQKKYLRLKNDGDCLECSIIDVYINDELYVNSMHPVTITCSYKNSDGLEYRFKSKPVLVDKYDFYKPGDKIKVYAGKGNYKDYIVEAGI